MECSIRLWEAGASPLLIVLISTYPFLLQSPFALGGKGTKTPFKEDTP